MNIQCRTAIAVLGLVFLISAPLSAQLVSPVVAVPGVAPTESTLSNLSVYAHPQSPVDPSKPTVVITHGWNPLPNRLRLTTQEAYALKIRSRHGARVNVLAWSWDSRNQGEPDLNDFQAIRQGQQLGTELLHRGIRPESTYFIGHSMGTLVVTKAASVIKSQTGRSVARLTFIDSPKTKLDTVFLELQATACAAQVKNYWADGRSGLGAAVDVPGVENILAPERGGRFCQPGTACINHVDILLWYYENFL